MEDNLQAQIFKNNELMVNSIKMLRKTGEDLAEAEREYKIILAQECLKLKDGGMPVTLIDKVCYGIKEVADARFKRDVAEAVYNANKESVQTTKMTIKILMNQYNKEWGINSDGM